MRKDAGSQEGGGQLDSSGSAEVLGWRCRILVLQQGCGGAVPGVKSARDEGKVVAVAASGRPALATGRGWAAAAAPLALALAVTCLLCAALPTAQANPEAKRLYDDLLSNYNRLIRPVGNNSDKLTVKMGLRLSQLIDINLKNQIMTTNVWVEQEWNDYKLKWNPDDYGGVDTLHVPSETIWLPDIVLYNNADGNYEVTIMTKAILHHTGKVIWKPPAIYKSFCEIDVEYFPFDQQICFMKFGSWTYDGYTVDLRHLLQTEDSNRIEVAVDLTDYYISVEWDILSVHAERHEKFYICCEEPYPDIIFYLRLRRKTLFYVVNLIIPCVGISFLSVLVFYLPSHSGEKVSLSISILLSLTVFFLLLVEIIPSTSLTVSLLGRYLLFTMVLVCLSVVVTIFVLNINFRSPVTHKMAPWVRVVFIDTLPKFLMLERPKKDEDDGANGHQNGGPGAGGSGDDDEEEDDDEDDDDEDDRRRLGKPPDAILTDVFRLGAPENDKYDGYCRAGPPASDGVGKRFSEYELPPGLPSLPGSALRLDFAVTVDPPPPPPPALALMPGAGGGGNPDDLFCPASPCNFMHHHHHHHHDDMRVSPNFDKQEVRPFERSIEDARFIAQHARNKDKFEAVEEDWKYVAMVVDRIFLWLFTLMCIVGTAIIIMQAPSLYDTTKPIDIQYSKIAKKKLMLLSMASEED